MTSREAVNWIINISADIGKREHKDLWHYEQALYEIRDMLQSDDLAQSLPNACADVTDTNDGDMISRQTTYLALVEKGQASRRYKLGETWELNGKEIREVLDALPSVQPELRTDGDMISRAQAMTEIQMNSKRLMLAYEAHAEGQVKFSDEIIGTSEAMDVLRNLPSVQPERKTGRWILWNYPGEECARCSVCSEEYDQMDLYIGGNEYPKFCPNCGARMVVEGEQ